MAVWQLLLSHHSSGDMDDEGLLNLGRSYEHSIHFVRKHFSPQAICIHKKLGCLTLPSKGKSGKKSYCGVRIHDFKYQEGNRLEGICFFSPRMLNFPKETGNFLREYKDIFNLKKFQKFLKSRYNTRCELSERVENWISGPVLFQLQWIISS